MTCATSDKNVKDWYGGAKHVLNDLLFYFHDVLIYYYDNLLGSYSLCYYLLLFILVFDLIFMIFYFSFRPSPFFFYCRMRFPILGQSVEKEKGDWS